MADNLIPGRSELACRALFGCSERERLLARNLLKNLAESKDDEHVWQTISRLWPTGSDRQDDWQNSPAGKTILELIGALQPGEEFELEGPQFTEGVPEPEPKAKPPPAAPVLSLESKRWPRGQL